MLLGSYCILYTNSYSIQFESRSFAAYLNFTVTRLVTTESFRADGIKLWLLLIGGS